MREGDCQGMSFPTESQSVPVQQAIRPPPDGVSADAWFLHQAARAIDADCPGEALRCIERASATDSYLVAAASAELRLLARAEALAQVARFADSQPACVPGLLVGAADCLEREPEGNALLDAAIHDDLLAARRLLGQMADRLNLPPATAHHLALLHLRAALHAEENSLPQVDELWRRSWRCWLRWASAASSDDRALVFDWLLALHRKRIKELLGRNAIEDARRPWQRVADLAGTSGELAERIARFRDELTAETLTAAREAMRYGVAAGWDNDYEAGLACLTRLLSLDRDDVRLLTELVVIGTEWLQECYANSDAGQLALLVNRVTPFGMRLTRFVDQSDGAELTARAALAEFTKFRGFVATDPARKAELYREALRHRPGSDDTRKLQEESQIPKGRQT